jgi:Fic family protein
VDELKQRIAARKAELDRQRSRAPHGLANFEHSQDLDITYTSNAIEGNTLTAARQALSSDPEPEDGSLPEDLS